MNLQRKLYREKIEERMLFKEEEEARDPFLHWPAAFYEEKNPEKRESLLLRRMQQEEAERQIEEDRLSVLYERYPVLKERREKEGSSRKQGLFSREAPLVDLYMYSWMNILIRGRNGIHFWNRKSARKEVEKLLRNFHFSLEEEGERCAPLRRRELEGFASFWIETCATDKSYGSTVFGLVRMKDSALSLKMAEEIGENLLFIPEKLGLDALAKPLRELFVEVYTGKVKEGEQCWQEIIKR